MDNIPSWSDLAKSTKPGRYQHFKGDYYQLLKVARHSETGEELAIYQSEKYPDRVWARPLAMFFDDVRRDGYAGPRFRAVED
ncbi:MAG: DUF1653 domain-containing protein [Patescibacteria group bacterium]